MCLFVPPYIINVDLWSFFFTFVGVNISLTIELGVFFTEIVNNLSRIILNFEMDLHVHTNIVIYA